MKNCQFVDKFGQANRVESAESYPKLFLNKKFTSKMTSLRPKLEKIKNIIKKIRKN